MRTLCIFNLFQFRGEKTNMMKLRKKQQHMYFKMDFSLDDDGMAYKTNRKHQSILQWQIVCIIYVREGKMEEQKVFNSVIIEK